ncbi:MAG: hypothetical protein KGD58_16050 [Candidatus Lokiarchaeota archaeon]|nr:hypothetical protein [Candidatus Lokiarchaeota archaeon]
MRKKTHRNEEIVYEEWVPAGGVVRSVMLIVFILIISIVIIVITFMPEDLMFIGIIFGAVSLFILLLYRNFRGLRIFITRHQIEVDYGIFNHKKIPVQKITGCEETKTNFRRYGGIGIRLGWDGSWAYSTDFGEAVKIILLEGRPFVFSTRNSQKICKLINEFTN